MSWCLLIATAPPCLPACCPSGTACAHVRMLPTLPSSSPKQEGLYLDSRTQRLLVQAVAYNPELRLFSSAIVTFEFGKGGSVQARRWLCDGRVLPWWGS